MRKMNKKQIESRIKMEANQIEVPDLKTQILAQVPKREVIVKEEKKRFNFSFHFSYIVSLAIVMIVAILIFNNNGSTPPNVLTKNVGEVEKAYAKQVVTLAGFAADIETANVAYTGLLSESNSTDYDSIADKINEYFKVVSLLLDEESTEYEIEVLEEGNYSYKLTTKYKVLKDTFETVIYYNEKPVEEKHKDKDDLDEIETTIEGLVVQGGIERSFYGNKEIEEDEIEVEITLEIDQNNYLKVSHEKESDERELKYEFFNKKPNENSHPYREVSISYDKENKNISIEFEEDNEEYEINFHYDGKGEEKRVEVQYHRGDEHHNGFIDDDEERDEYRYDFGNGKLSYGDKPKGHGHNKEHGDKGWDH